MAEKQKAERGARASARNHSSQIELFRTRIGIFAARHGLGAAALPHREGRRRAKHSYTPFFAAGGHDGVFVACPDEPALMHNDTLPSPDVTSATRRILPWLVAVAFFMESLDTTILNTAVPVVAKAIGASPLSMKAVMASYTLSLAVFIPLSGWVADRSAPGASSLRPSAFSRWDRACAGLIERYPSCWSPAACCRAAAAP